MVQNQSGYLSLLLLLLLTLFSGLGMEVYLKANAENRMVKRETQSRQALYIAEGGIEWAKAHLLVNPELRQGSLSFDTGQVDILIEFSGGEYKVTSKGLSGLAVRRIEERLELVNGTWVIKGYQELHW
ncbi:hypothetical protein SAMN02746098_02808 [Desulfosporosinus lacus DSM 15449]|uniref:Uncharacterized protein n=2 Tax=Desulfosporosinus TaxID=79206 RepID=A0A1M5Z089_9FIRM|nr:hypothetical protein SAMN02746098_02808 [Desulfosporosinus lacus DSM 15449]